MSHSNNKINKEIKQWVSCWQKAEPHLKRLRDLEIKNTDTAMGIKVLNDAFDSAISKFHPRKTSGLIEQQMYFRRIVK
ncbi:MAG: hypothetical protein KAR84_08320 [Elusimicrobiales bacterium]|nr:hypothetical protein [Elusimicrobiales bacterium]